MSDKKAKSTRGRFATSDISKLKQSEMVNIEGRFYLTTVKEMHRHYNTYNGIDVQTSRWITVYVKVVTINSFRKARNSHCLQRLNRKFVILYLQSYFGKESCSLTEVITMHKYIKMEALLFNSYFKNLELRYLQNNFFIFCYNWYIFFNKAQTYLKII